MAESNWIPGRSIMEILNARLAECEARGVRILVSETNGTVSVQGLATEPDRFFVAKRYFDRVYDPDVVIDAIAAVEMEIQNDRDAWLVGRNPDAR
jgi:hypothetical protein